MAYGWIFFFEPSKIQIQRVRMLQFDIIDRLYCLSSGCVRWSRAAILNLGFQVVHELGWRKNYDLISLTSN